MYSTYKVVKNNSGVLTSAVTSRNSMLDLTYVPGEWTKEKIISIGLFCFSDLSAAKEFINYMNRKDLEIWVCAAENPRSTRIRFFPGTELFGSVKLLKRIWPNEDTK